MPTAKGAISQNAFVVLKRDYLGTDEPANLKTYAGDTMHYIEYDADSEAYYLISPLAFFTSRGAAQEYQRNTDEDVLFTILETSIIYAA